MTTNREIAAKFLTEHVEELLAEKGIVIPSDDREGDEDEGCLYGSEYYSLEDALTDMLDEAYPDGAVDEDELPNESYLTELCEQSGLRWEKRDSYSLYDGDEKLGDYDDLEDIVGSVAFLISGEEEA